MKTTTRVGIAFAAIVFGLVVSPAIALDEAEAVRKSTTLQTNSQYSITKTVAITGDRDSRFVPQIVYINVNDSIKFINQDGQNGGFAHGIISIDPGTNTPDGSFQGYLQNVGDVWIIKFSESGIYYYVDSIYPDTYGTIVVS